MRRCKGLTSSCTRDIPRKKGGRHAGQEYVRNIVRSTVARAAFFRSFSQPRKGGFLISYHTGSRGEEKRNVRRAAVELHVIQSTKELPCFQSQPSLSGLKNVCIRSFPSSSGILNGSVFILSYKLCKNNASKIRNVQYKRNYPT